jgi:hypothetical protein
MYANPTSVQTDCLDPILSRGARSRFRASASELLLFTRGCLDLPGRITYEDEVQVVAVPFAYSEGWPFEDSGQSS